MKSELYKAFKAIDFKNLDEEDKDELLRIFNDTKNDLIRNQIAFIFCDLNFSKAIPFIIKKINDVNLSHKNGSLVYALSEMDTKSYFIKIISILCTKEYEPRQLAYEIIHKYLSDISNRTRQKSLKILNSYNEKLKDNFDSVSGENSASHFIDETIKLLKI